MSYRKHLTLLLGICYLCVLAGNKPQGSGRNMLRTNKLDTLKLTERFNFKTNMLGWLLMSPNVGIEMTLGSHNWNCWTIGLSGRTMWATTTQVEVPYTQHQLNEGRLEVRRYKHGKGLMRSWFTGVYGGYAKFDLKLSETGYQGDGFIGGVTFGTVAPLHGYRNGSSLDLELSVNAGLVWTHVDEYTCSDGREYYVVTRHDGGRRFLWDPLPFAACNDLLRVSLVYHFGPSVADRYRERIAIDDNYRALQNELALQRDSAEQALRLKKQQEEDSLKLADYEERFEEQRLELERRHIRDSLARAKKRAPGRWEK